MFDKNQDKVQSKGMNNTTTTETIPTHFATSYTFTAPNGFSETYTIRLVGCTTKEIHTQIRNVCALRSKLVQEGWTYTRHEHIA